MSCELFVGNLNPEVRMRDLENCFGRYGKILRCDLKKNFGFIQFEDRRDAEMAIRKENNRRLLGSDMTVEWARGSVGDKSRHTAGGPPFRRPHSSDRFNPRLAFNGSRPRSPPMRVRDRSPIMRGGRERSPIGRGNFPSINNRGFAPREDRFSSSRRSFDNRDGFNDPPSRFNDRGTRSDRFLTRDRFSGDRFSSSRGPPSSDRSFNRGPPPRMNSYDDRRGDRFQDKRDSYNERRSFGGGPRRF